MAAKGKSVGDKSGKSIACYTPEPLRPHTPIPVGTDPTSLPFLEWSDQEINSEKWDLPKSKEAAKPVKGIGPVGQADVPLQFTDTHVIHLPESLPVYEWKRPAEVFPKANFVMYKDASEYPDLISESKHILHSDFMRSFISAVGILEYLGNTQTFPIEFASPKFTPNTNDIPWRPWHHIYSMCKAGKGQKHNPQANTLGKYVLRFYWMGSWRKVIIDDLLPVEESNHVQLPQLSSFGEPNNPETQTVEMWPFLLCKGLLKISSLSFSKITELHDFDIVHCLTGWFVQTIEVHGLQVTDIWEMCCGYSDHFVWPEPGADKASKKGSEKESDKKAKNFLDDEKGIQPFHLIASCIDMRSVANDEVPDISPCWSHTFLIDQTREIPLIKPAPLPELERWKRFRWTAWAIARGKFPPPLLVPIKCFKMFSAFKKCSEHVIYEPLSKEALLLKKSVEVIEDLALSLKGKDKSKEKSEASKKSDKDAKGKVGEKVVPLPPDPSLWGDFNKLGRYINCLYIFFKPSQFKCNVKITDILQAAGGKAADKPKKGDTGGPELLMWNSELLVSRNEPIYIFADSVGYKLVILNFAQIGNVHNLNAQFDYELANLKKPSVKEIFQEPPRRCHHADLIITSNEVDDEPSITLSNLEDPESININAYEKDPFAYVVLEDYNWQTSKIGDMVTFFNSYGSKTIMIDIKPGRFVARLWVKSDTSFSMSILSDIPITVGTLEVVTESMRQEPQKLLQICNDISSTYGQLVQNFGTTGYLDGLKNFFRSYFSDLLKSPLKKSEMFQIHCSFMNEFLQKIKETCSEVEFKQRVFALRVLFLNPFISLHEIKINAMIDKNSDSCSCSISETSEEIEFAKKSERAAVVLQAFFKMVYIKKLKLLHNENHPRYMKIFDNLKKIYTDLFGVKMRMFICSKLVRSFLLSNSDMIDLRKHYSLFNDLNNTITLQHFSGITMAKETTWVPIARYVFYINCPFAIILKIYLFCDISKYMVRVFNNDTKKESLRYTNTAVVQYYESNSSGYTVVCYGWSESQTTKQWKLEFITLKQFEFNLLIIPPIEICNNVLIENYLPNVYNILCKCLISINHDVSISIRLSTDFEQVKILIRCLNEVGHVFGEATSVQNVLLPQVQLEYIPIAEKISEHFSNMSSLTIDSKSSRKKSKVRSRSGSLGRASAALKRKNRNSDRLSLKQPPKSSISSSRKDESSMGLSDIVTFKDTIYIIEAYVVDDTWPLFPEEWDLVAQIKKNKLLGPPENSETSVIDTTPRQSKETKKTVSIDSNTKRNPLWTLEIISSADDNVIAAVDTRREEEIKILKVKWWEEDVMRYELSWSLRENFLQSHYPKVKSFETFDSNTTDANKILSELVGTSQQEELLVFDNASSMNWSFQHVRSHKRGISESKILPYFNLADYMVGKDGVSYESITSSEDIEIDKKVKTPEDEQKEIVLRNQATADFDDYLQRFKNDMEKYLCDQVASFRLQQIFYKNCREDSKKIMQQSYDLREKIINALIAEEMANNPPPPPTAIGGKKK